MAPDHYAKEALDAAAKAPAIVAIALAAAATFLAFYPYVSTYHNTVAVGAAVFLDCLAILRLGVDAANMNRRRKAAARGTFFLTPQEGQSVWGILQQPGGRRTSFLHAALLAKNRTEEELHFARATLLRPNLGPTLRPLFTISDGPGMSSMLPGGTHFLKVNMAFEVVPNHTEAMDAVIELADSDGNVKKVKVRAAYLPTDTSKSPAASVPVR